MLPAGSTEYRAPRQPSSGLFGFDRTRRISAQSAENIATATQAFGRHGDIAI
jgi:hypothetical protein